MNLLVESWNAGAVGPSFGTGNFRMMLVAFGTKKYAFVVEKTNIIVKGSITVKRLSNRPGTEAEPRKEVVFPPPGYVNASKTLTTICSLKYMGQMAV